MVALKHTIIHNGRYCCNGQQFSVCFLCNYYKTDVYYIKDTYT